MSNKPFSSKQYKDCYSILLNIVKLEGFIITHVKSMNSAYGYIDIDKRKIVIDNSLSYKQKLAVLAHEYGHLCQLKDILLYNTVTSKSFKSKHKHCYSNKSLQPNKLIITMDWWFTTKFRTLKDVDKYIIGKKKDVAKHSVYLFQVGQMEDNEENLNIIKFCEKDASARGKKIVATYFGAKMANSLYWNELDSNPEVQSYLADAWRSDYLASDR